MITGISFFKHRVMSAYIRAEQIAPFIGAKLNPLDGYENDICIFIKNTPSIDKWKSLYLDVVDRHQCIKWLYRHPDCNVIAISRVAKEYLSEQLPNQKSIVFIPQQHCNFDNEQRTRSEVKIAGYCGEYHTFAPFENEIRDRLSKIGMELKFYSAYKTRQDVINFYKTIDVQIIWRTELGYVKLLKNPLKLSNAGSFGIPTVAYPEENFESEYGGCYLSATNLDQLIDWINDLKNIPSMYFELSNKAQERAKNYHVTEVAKYYRKLVDCDSN